METKKFLLQHAALLRFMASAAAMMVVASCSRDDIDTVPTTGRSLRFEVSTAEGWRASSATRCESDVCDGELLTLRGEREADTLFVRSSVADGISCCAIGGSDALTRGAIATEMYDAFGVLGYLYTGDWNSDSVTPDFMYDVAVRQTSDGVWTPDDIYFWPGGSRKLRFFAYAPYRSSGIVLSDKSTAGAPTIAYTVPAAVADQKDILTASSDEFEGNRQSAAPLSFTHALTAIRFVVGDNMLAGRISKISLKGVYGHGTYSFADGKWGAHADSKTFSQTLAVDVDGTPDSSIADDAATFMMIPQSLPSGAAIEVVFTDKLTNTARTLTASIVGTDWPMGKTVTYRISTSSITVTPTFSVTASADFTYVGGSKTYTVTSSAVVTGSTKTIDMKWTAEFVEDDGNGGYRTIDRPDWITSFPATGDGGIGKTGTVQVAAQMGVTSNPHNTALQAATSVSGTYDLSTKGGTAQMNTANCYIINAPGTYSLPLVYGNAVKNGATNSSAYTSTATGNYALQTFVNHLNAAITDPYIYKNADCTPFDATLVWQDEENLVTNVSLSSDKHSLTFEIGAATIRQGNAIVAVRDNSNRIMWSWHIWVTDYKLGDDIRTVTNYQGKTYGFMPVNIGWCDAETTTYDARSVKVRFTQTETGATQVITLKQTSHTVVNSGNNPYFQFGRKDPMLPGIRNASGSTEDKGCYSAGYAFDKSGTGKVAVGTSIQNPHIFYNYGGSSPYDWCSASATVSGKTSFYNLWSANNTATSANDNEVVKTIYDPSPVGFHLPASNAFTGFTYNGNSVSGTSYFGSRFNSPYTSTTEFTANFGWEFYCNKMNGEGNYDTAGGTIFFPASGYRNYSSGTVYLVGYSGYYWSAVPYSTYNGRYLYFYSSYVSPLNNYNRTSGFAVRPLQE